MALEKITKVDRISVVGDYAINVREVTMVMDGDVQIGASSYQRHVVNPNTILASEDDRVKKIAESLWGDTEKEEYFVMQNGHPSGEPANSWTALQLQKYLSNNGVSYTESEAKSSLLTKAKAKYSE
tara:strand:+ start:1185 stop:1562 length:378 start_codon:yes stop_codon:yes gene_type:complete